MLIFFIYLKTVDENDEVFNNIYADDSSSLSSFCIWLVSCC
jgi:hypothetical protein